jgi:hypothetical protein
MGLFSGSKPAPESRANARTALVPGARANRERGLSGPPTARQRTNVVTAVATGQMSPRRGLAALEIKAPKDNFHR